MVIEPDCRVHGEFWDRTLFYEGMTINREFVLAGTPVAFHTQFASPCIRTFVQVYLRDYNRRTGTQVRPLAGEWLKQHEWAFFPNGALAIYRTKETIQAWRNRIFLGTPWDMRIGLELARTLGFDYFDRFALLTKELSFNGECYTTRDFQKAQLVNGNVVAIHNIKDTWMP